MDNQIGLTVKRLRIQNRLTQQQVADACGLSKGMISKIETGKVMPAIATLSRIAHTLNVKVSLLMEESSTRETSCQSTNIPLDEYQKTDMGYRFSTLAAEYGDKQIQPLMFYANNKEIKPHLVSHQGEECIYIVDGDMHFSIGGTSYFLQKGDILYFDGLQPHGIEKVDNEVYYLNLFSGREYTSKVFPDK